MDHNNIRKEAVCESVVKIGIMMQCKARLSTYKSQQNNISIGLLLPLSKEQRNTVKQHG